MQQVERRVEVDVDEVGHLDGVELVQPGAEPLESGGVLWSGERLDLGEHLTAVVPDPQRRPVGVDGPVHRIDRPNRAVVGHLGPDRPERVGEQLGHRQHRRAVVEPEPGLGDQPRSPARDRLALDHGDVVSGGDQVGGGRQSTETGADDDHPLRGGRHRAAGDSLRGVGHRAAVTRCARRRSEPTPRGRPGLGSSVPRRAVTRWRWLSAHRSALRGQPTRRSR